MSLLPRGVFWHSVNILIPLPTFQYIELCHTKRGLRLSMLQQTLECSMLRVHASGLLFYSLRKRSLALVCNLFTAKLDERFSQFQQEMSSSQATCLHQVLDKLKKKTNNFKKKGCEEQFSFNNKVDDRVQAAKKQSSKVTACNNSSQ